MKISVRDPAGLTHAVFRVGNDWHGMENVAHWALPSMRPRIIADLKEALLRPHANGQMTVHGFTVYPFSCPVLRGALGEELPEVLT